MAGRQVAPAADGVLLARDLAAPGELADGADVRAIVRLGDSGVRTPLGTVPNNKLTLSNLELNNNRCDMLKNNMLDQHGRVHGAARDAARVEQRGGRGFHSAADAAAAAAGNATGMQQQQQQQQRTALLGEGTVAYAHELQACSDSKGSSGSRGGSSGSSSGPAALPSPSPTPAPELTAPASSHARCSNHRSNRSSL